MKTLLKISLIATIPIIYIGMVLPMCLMLDFSSKPNENAFWIFMLVYAMCMALVVTTQFSLTRYVSKIDKLDEAAAEKYEEAQELKKVRQKYEQLILDTQTNT